MKQQTMIERQNVMYSYFIDRLPLFYVFMSGIGFSLQTLIIKLLAEGGFRGSFYCVFSRGLIQIILSIIFILINTVNELPTDGPPVDLFGNTNYVRIVMALRSFIGFFSIAFAFLSAEYIPIGDSTILVMLSPIVAAMASFVILGEPWYIAEFIATVLSVIGAVLVAQPPFIFGYDKTESKSDHQQFSLGVLFGLSSAVFAGFAFVLIRMLGTSAKMPWANVCYVQSIGQLVLSVPALYISGQNVESQLSSWEIFLIFLGGFIGAWSQIAMTLGMQKEKSAAASAMRMSDVVFGFIWQVAFTVDKLSLLSLFGACLVTSSILVIVFSKGKSTPVPTVTTKEAITSDTSTIQMTPLHYIKQGNRIGSDISPISVTSAAAAAAAASSDLDVTIHAGQDKNSKFALKSFLNRDVSHQQKETKKLEYSSLPQGDDD